MGRVRQLPPPNDAFATPITRRPLSAISCTCAERTAWRSASKWQRSAMASGAPFVATT